MLTKYNLVYLSKNKIIKSLVEGNNDIVWETRVQNVATKDILPLNMGDPNSGDKLVYKSSKRFKLVCKSIKKESHKESLKDTSHEDTLENISASNFIEIFHGNIATEVNNSLQCSCYSIDFAVTYSNSINITNISSDSIGTLPVKILLTLKILLLTLGQINATNIFRKNYQNSQRHH